MFCVNSNQLTQFPSSQRLESTREVISFKTYSSLFSSDCSRLIWGSDNLLVQPIAGLEWLTGFHNLPDNQISSRTFLKASFFFIQSLEKPHASRIKLSCIFRVNEPLLVCLVRHSSRISVLIGNQGVNNWNYLKSVVIGTSGAGYA